MMAEDRPEVRAQTRAELRDWLGQNHATSAPVWLVSPRKGQPGYFSYEELVEELIAWGWIDSLPRAIDHAFSANLIARRNPKSAWSAVNKAHAERARGTGIMTPAGEAAIAAAKANGQWDFLNDVEALILPPDLEAALTGEARTVWDAYPRTIKRATLEWIKTAKTAPTRTTRIAEVAGSAGEGLRPKPFRR